MLYQPTSHDALNVYRLAANHHGASSNDVDPPSQADVKQTTMCAFRILAKERRDASGMTLADRAICLYDRVTCLWFVRLQAGAVLMLRPQDNGEEDNGFSIVLNYGVEN